MCHQPSKNRQRTFLCNELFYATCLCTANPKLETYIGQISTGYDLLQGVTFPSNHAIWAKWAPAPERSTLITMAIAGMYQRHYFNLDDTLILLFQASWPMLAYRGLI